jgi:hypothetical protein
MKRRHARFFLVRIALYFNIMSVLIRSVNDEIEHLEGQKTGKSYFLVNHYSWFICVNNQFIDCQFGNSLLIFRENGIEVTLFNTNYHS